MDLKKQAAEKAVEFVEDGMVVGLGGGAAVAHLAGLIKTRIDEGMKLKLVTSSFTTRQVMEQHGLPIIEMAYTKNIDVYFDGCDQFDKDLNALKSGGGIHTHEKLLATLADEFILVGDESKYVQSLELKFPLVIEVIPEAYTIAPLMIKKLYPEARVEIRINNKKDGPVYTDNGNYLFDMWFPRWPELSAVNPRIKSVAGVLETSLFFNIAKKGIIGTSNGAKVIEKGS